MHEVMQGAQQVKPKITQYCVYDDKVDKIYDMILTGIKGDFSGKIAYDRVGYAKKSCVAFGRIGCGRL